MNPAETTEFLLELTRKNSIGTLLGTEFMSTGSEGRVLVSIVETHCPAGRSLK